MRKETVEKQAKEKNIKTKVIAIGGVIGTVVLGGLCYKLYRDNCSLKLSMVALQNEMTNKDNELDFCHNYMEKANDIIAHIKQSVGEIALVRLIKNEELVLSRTENKIDRIKKDTLAKKGVLDDAKKLVLQELEERRQNSIETIADFVKAKNMLQ